MSGTTVLHCEDLQKSVFVLTVSRDGKKSLEQRRWVSGDSFDDEYDRFRATCTCPAKRHEWFESRSMLLATSDVHDRWTDRVWTSVNRP